MSTESDFSTESFYEESSNDPLHEPYLKNREKSSIVKYVLLSVFFIAIFFLMITIGIVVFKNWSNRSISYNEYPHLSTPLYQAEISTLPSQGTQKSKPQDVKIIYEGMNSVFPIQGPNDSKMMEDPDVIEISISFYCCPKNRYGKSLETCNIVRKGMAFQLPIPKGTRNQYMSRIDEELGKALIEKQEEASVCPEGEVLAIDVEDHRIVNPQFDCFGRCSVVKDKESIFYENPHFLENYHEAFVNSGEDRVKEKREEFDELEDSEKLGFLKKTLIEELDNLPCSEIRQEKRIENSDTFLSGSFHGDADSVYEVQTLRPWCDAVEMKLAAKNKEYPVKLRKVCTSYPGDGVCLKAIPKFQMVDQGKDAKSF